MTIQLAISPPKRPRARAFPSTMMAFLRDLEANNNTRWFHENRERYHEEVVEPLKKFIADLRPWLLALNPSLDVSYKVNTTVMRINRDRRFAPGAPPYRGYVKVSFPLQAHKWSTDPVFGFGIFPSYAYVAFRNAGEKRRPFVDRYFENLRRHRRLVERWATTFDIPSRLVLLGGEHDAVEAEGPCPSGSADWLAIEDPTVGAHWTSKAIDRLGRSFNDVVLEKLTLVYFLKLLAVSDDVPRDAEAYFEVARARCGSSTSA
ncbi:DUF2461 family protein [Sorangium sp. So ce119]|uniref:DUF2461 family protein n=1 Tax=Sorangium sp. So ce119 TaxID=3133279 RepID=UPI003F647E96